MSSTALPPGTAEQLRAALRKHAGKWIAANYRHQVLVARTVKGMQQKAVDEFQRTIVAPMLREVGARLTTFDERGPSVVIEQFPELRALQAEVVGIVSRGSESVQRLAKQNLATLARHEIEWGRESAAKVLRVTPSSVNEKVVQQTALERPFMGQRLDVWFRDMLTQPAAKNAVQWIQTGLNNGLLTDAIVKGLRGTPASGYMDGWLTGSSRDLSTLVRTASTHYSATANHATFKVLGFDRYRWVATLDTRTCPICGQLDGEVFEVDKGPLPPAPHANCRCATVPWFGDPEGTRASTDGQVPADMTFEQWIEGQGIEAQNEVFGKTRASAWRSGKLTLPKMLGSDMQILTIDELRRLDRIPDPKDEDE